MRYHLHLGIEIRCYHRWVTVYRVLQVPASASVAVLSGPREAVSGHQLASLHSRGSG